MEWKSVMANKPKMDSMCIVLDSNGCYCIRKYTRVVVCGNKWNTQEHAKATGKTVTEQKEMFIPDGSNYGPLPRRANKTYLYYIELPEPPSGVDEAREIRAQIKELEKRLIKLGGMA